MKIATGWSTNGDAESAIEEAWGSILDGLNENIVLVQCSASAAYTAEQLQAKLKALVPEGCKIAATSSCLGAMSNQGFHSDDGAGLCLIAFADEGDFGVGLSRQHNDPVRAASSATFQAIDDANRPGELPVLVWVNAAPGAEESVLEGIVEAIGNNVPIMGGSSADNNITGEWWQFSAMEQTSDGVLIIAMYPEAKVGFSFHSGYLATEHAAVVTKSSGRIIYSLDNLPAAQVYDKWVDGGIGEQMAGGNILQQTTLFPLGRETGQIEDIPYYTLMHPDQVLEEGALSLFSNIETGEQVTLMQGSADSLASRAGSVVSGILERQNWQAEQVCGALIVYCAGCMLGIQERMDEVSQGIDRSLDGAPFSGLFTFGEQGCFIDGISRHGNLMISAVVFANEN